MIGTKSHTPCPICGNYKSDDCHYDGELIAKQFHIYHSTGINKFEEVEVQQREYAGFVIASSIQQAFELSQNVVESWNTVYPCRSTSVGDVIQDDDKFFMVCGTGFKELI